MPNLDRTGPQGQGAMTGRRRGRCANTQTLQTEKSDAQTVETKEEILGLGRGGRPRGGGGFGFGGGGGRKRQGRGRGRGFGGNQ
ncbi:MAG: DUF5320 domain-containing protein [bacterium]